jgi:MFS family permease
MDDIVEMVDLPDPGVQQLVHPLDLPEARTTFRNGWIIGLLTGPVVGVALGAVAWWTSGSYVIAVIAGLVLVVAGTYAGRVQREEAWAFIPRKRQDRERILPAAWELIQGIVIGSSLAVTILIVAGRLAEPDIPLGVRQFVVGMGVVAILIVVVDLVSGVLLHRGAAAGRPWLALPVVIAVIGSGAIAFGLLIGLSAPATSGSTLLGGATMLVVGVAVLGWERLAGRGSADQV